MSWMAAGPLCSLAVSKESLKILENNLKFVAHINRDYDDMGYTPAPMSFAKKVSIKIGLYLSRVKDSWRVLTGKASIDYYD